MSSRAEFDRNQNLQYLDLQVLLAIAYGIQLGRQRRLEALNILTEQCVRATRASSAAIAIVRDDELHTLAYYGTLAQHLSLRAPLGESLVAKCVRTGTPQIRYESPQAPAEIQSIIYWPLLGRDGGRGVFALFERMPYAFTEDDLEIVAKFVRGIHGVLGWQREVISSDPVQVNLDAPAVTEEEPRPIPIEASQTAEESVVATPIVELEPLARYVDALKPAEPVPVLFETVPHDDYTLAEVEEPSKAGRYAAVVIVILLAIAGFMYVNRGRQQMQLADTAPAAPVSKAIAPAVSTTPPKAEQLGVSAEPQPTLLEPIGLPDGKVNVEAIAVHSDAGHDVVALRLSGQTTYKVVRLSKPDRIFIDFPQVAPSRMTNRIPPASTVLGVRIGFEEGRGLRIVLDLSQRADYLIVHSADGKSIVLTVSPVGSRG